FPAGLVIYWAWNNTLSGIQQSVIMHKHGAKIELWDNLKGTFAKKKAQGGGRRSSLRVFGGQRKSGDGFEYPFLERILSNSYLARHARPCAGHPRFLFLGATETWMAGTSPAMTGGLASAFTSADIEAGRKLFAGDWRFAAAAGSVESLPPMRGIEGAVAGRSNVGKSSLINALTRRRALARTSPTPGRTPELAF